MTEPQLSERVERSRRVLVVDDDREFAESLRLLLSTKGYDVCMANKADAAMQQLADVAVDVALIDVRLQSSSGIELISNLRQSCPGLLCVMMSAYASMDTAIKALQEGAYDYLQKPFHTNELMATLKRCFGQLDLEAQKAEVEGALRKAYAEMEARVEERTAELSAANERLLVEISERREAEREAENANRAKTEFVSRMTHELRTPLNAVLGFGQLLELEETLTKKQRSFVLYIAKAGQHLLNLIDDVLDLAHAETGRMQLFMEAVDPGVVAQECTELIQPIADKREVALECRIAPGTTPAVWADATRLKQVLLNLMSNGVKYNHRRGRLTVSCEETPDATLRISLNDSGPGIPKERLDELFVPFSRLGAERSEVEGSGMGLAITQRLVGAMGATLGVESTFGEGSTFSVELKLAPGPAAALSKADLPLVDTPAAAGEVRHSVLYIEDNPASIVLMRETLERRSGTMLIDAPNAELGLELARTQRPDVILMDINLPGLNGYQALQALKADEATREIPVIAVSALAQKTNKGGRTAEFCDYVAKPIELKRLNDALDRALR